MIPGGIESKMEKLVEHLDDYRPDQVSEIKTMQKSLKAAMLKKNFKEHPALRLLIDTLKKREASYTVVLSDKEDLEHEKRQAFFARRAEVRFVLSFFEVDSTIDSIEKRLDGELDYHLSGDVQRS